MTDHFDDIDDDELAALRRRVEWKALVAAERMLDDDATPPTARASVIRGAIGDAAARRHDVPPGADDLSQFSRGALVGRLAELERSLARAEADDAMLIEAKPTAGVFD